MDFQQLQDYARQRIGIVNSQAVTDLELQQMLNLSLGSLDSVLCTTYEDYKLTKYFATLGGGGGPNTGSPPNLIPLPPDFLKLRGVDYVAPGMWVNVYGFGLQERNRYNNPIANMFVPYGNQASRTVRVMDQFIYVEPQNTCTGQYQERFFCWGNHRCLLKGVQRFRSVGQEASTNGFQPTAVPSRGAL